MISEALELIRVVEARGGKLFVEGEYLIVEPAEAGEPLADKLRAHKKQIIDLLIGCPKFSDHDIDPWREDFLRWLEGNCVSRPDREDSTSVSCLLINFCEWGTTHNSVPCSRPVFERLLMGSGFRLKDGLASPLLLKADLQVYADFREYTQKVQSSDASKFSRRAKGAVRHANKK